MQKDLNSLLNSDQGQKLAGKRDEIEKLASSSDGEKVTKMAANDTVLQSAIKNGDMEAMRQRLTAILKTDEGSRVFRQISDMMK